jgi:hypothetical protein
VPKLYIDPVVYVRAVEAAHLQLAFGTERRAMTDASDALRRLDPGHPFINALETRIGKLFNNHFHHLRQTVRRARCA